MASRTDGTGSNANRLVTVFGGTGFLGRRIVERLGEKGFPVRVASRHPSRVRPGRSTSAVEAVKADILDASSIASATGGSYAVINAVSLYVEHGELTFERVHVKAAAELAAAALARHVDRFVQISGIGSDPRSDSKYIAARGRGEAAVAKAFPGALIVRPAVMMGRDDAFLTTIVRLMRRLPLYPLFGQGQTRLQPAYVEDVAEAVARLIEGRNHIRSPVFELGGPHTYTYRELLREIGRQLGISVTLMPMPFAAWTAVAGIAESLSAPPITRNQVELMQQDNIAGRGLPGFLELGVEPKTVDDVIRLIEHQS
ncbi:complex I NDUFA9 subunit family protein [Mesorhizobium sp. BAC0120]|uniref:complex I NDUFA9 subunit family protein n=1 Tax=Mesorhizobium sp. BAC0120 TaxID=3090670 RepID=UPI00298D1839|nr:complex I NDUFA9 subunit family protein [Mesorhizobium sp. BAC0120]MDW6023623.1 complex I NDUFA9 subunit family protein [Mesorhizobium sp. BAC0120]